VGGAGIDLIWPVFNSSWGSSQHPPEDGLHANHLRFISMAHSLMMSVAWGPVLVVTARAARFTGAWSPWW
jgi:hypothetical protein